MIIMYCTKCGNQVADTDRFCTKCGMAIKTDAVEKEAAVIRNSDEVATNQICEAAKKHTVSRHDKVMLTILGVMLSFGSLFALFGFDSSSEERLGCVALCFFIFLVSFGSVILRSCVLPRVARRVRVRIAIAIGVVIGVVFGVVVFSARPDWCKEHWLLTLGIITLPTRFIYKKLVDDIK